MADPVIPLFSTSSSLKDGGIFTIEKAGAAAEAGRVRGPVSLCDLAKEEGLKKLHIVASNFADFMMGYKNLAKVGCDMAFGLKLVICEDIATKDEASFKSESKVILFMKNDKAYHALINLYTKAAIDGFYYVPRLDWKTLKYMWSDDLILALPFYSSFLAKNTMTFATIAPELPVKPLLLREVGQEMPFDDILGESVDRYAAASGAEIQAVKSIYYKRREDAKAWQVWRCILNRTVFDNPGMEHLCSREFCWQSFKELPQ
jgi:DNA polymerase-3 subunit alpha